MSNMKIGETRKFLGVRIKCVEGYSCADCIFYNNDCKTICCTMGSCFISEREDDTSVVFVNHTNNIVSKTINTIRRRLKQVERNLNELEELLEEDNQNWR